MTKNWNTRAVATPEPGYFRVRLVRKGPLVPARIVFTNGLWNAVVDGMIYPSAPEPSGAPRVFFIWHGGEIVSEAKYFHDITTRARFVEADETQALRDPFKPIRLDEMPPLF
jgi:hypothetical protein